MCLCACVLAVKHKYIILRVHWKWRGGSTRGVIVDPASLIPFGSRRLSARAEIVTLWGGRHLKSRLQHLTRHHFHTRRSQSGTQRPTRLRVAAYPKANHGTTVITVRHHPPLLHLLIPTQPHGSPLSSFDAAFLFFPPRHPSVPSRKVTVHHCNPPTPPLPNHLDTASCHSLNSHNIFLFA